MRVVLLCMRGELVLARNGDLPDGDVEPDAAPDGTAAAVLAGLGGTGVPELIAVDRGSAYYAVAWPKGSEPPSGYGWIDPAPPDVARALRAWAMHRVFCGQTKLTVDVVLVRDDAILVLERPNGFWYIPGGVVDPGEDPRDAAVRETFEETGLAVPDARIVRAWSYTVDHGRDAFHVTYAAQAPDGDVAITAEHRAHRWMTPDDYTAYLRPSIEEGRDFARQVVQNIELALEVLGR